jgi:hypothetical protein
LLDEAVWDEALLVRQPRETLDLLVRYILRADVDNDAFDRRVAAIQQPEVKSATMSLAEQIRQKGVTQGRRKGSLRTLQDSILELLEVRFGEVSPAYQRSVRAINEEARLKRLLIAASQAVSLEAFSLSF